MEECLRGVLDDFPEEITETPETPAASKLFNFRDDNERELLNKKQDQAFHHAVAQSEIAFLTTRVRNPEKDKWKKLRRLLGYLKQTIKLPLILQADGVNVIKWWVDASYAAHENMEGHTVGTMSMGKGGHG